MINPHLSVTQVTVSDRGQGASLRIVVVRFDFATAYRDEPPVCFCAAVAQIVQRRLAPLAWGRIVGDGRRTIPAVRIN